MDPGQDIDPRRHVGGERTSSTDARTRRVARTPRPPMRRVLAVLLVAALAACGGTPPSTVIDGYFRGRAVYGAEPPEGALVVTPEQFIALAERDDFVWDSVARQEHLRAEAEARFAADEQEVLALIAADPGLAWILDEPDPSDPDIETLPNGEYLESMLDEHGTISQVRTMGHADRYADFLAARERYLDAGNQLAGYTAAFEALPPDLREGLATPASLSGASAAAIIEAATALEARLAEDLDALTELSERLYLHAHGGGAAEAAVDPQGVDRLRHPDSPGGEVGAGLGLDRPSTCPFDPIGLYQNFWWPLKYYTTSVKSQGRRGSCVAFALTSALETSVAVRAGEWVNLSEQFLYYQIKGHWQPAHYGDGARTTAMAQRFADSGYRLPFEEAWNYNTSDDRMDLGLTYGLSCFGYGEHCSNTTHQGRYVCTAVNSVQLYCGYHAPSAPSGLGYRMPDANVYWVRFLPVPVLTTWLYLLQGHSIVASLDVDSQFKSPTAGYVTSSTGARGGGHAVHITGFIPTSLVLASDVHPFVKSAAADSGGGFFIVKNSWGGCKGDGGYLYIPVAWALERFKSLTVFDRGSAPSFLAAEPDVDIVSPADGTSIPYGGFNWVSLVATVSDHHPYSESCCPVTWTSDLDGVLGQGTTLDHAFASPGTRLVTATATTGQGHSASASVTVHATNTPPTVTVLAPSPNEELHLGVPTVLQAVASDPNEVGGVDCASFAWASSEPGDPAPAGCSPTATFDTLGSRVLTATATDAFGATDSASVTVVVVEPPDYWAVITDPKDGDVIFPSETITLRASISSAFALGAPYEWRAYSAPESFDVIASGTVQSARDAPRAIPPHEWGTGLGHEGRAYALRVVVDDAVLSDEVTVHFVVIPK